MNIGSFNSLLRRNEDTIRDSIKRFQKQEIARPDSTVNCVVSDAEGSHLRNI